MVRFFLVFVLTFTGWPVWAQSCPPFPVRGVQVIDALYDQGLANGTDDQRRALTRSILEQLVFEAPQDGWTWKSADPGRPPSKDALARIVGGRLCSWDWQNGSTRRRAVNAGDLGDDITGQNPIPVPGVNHLQDPGPGPAPQPIPTPTPGVDWSGIYSRLDGLTIRSDATAAALERIYEDLAARDAERKAQMAAVDARLAQHDQEPTWVGKLIRNPAFYAVVGPILTYFTTQAMQKPTP